MKVARLAVLGIALAAGGGAAYLMTSTPKPEAVQALAPAPAPVMETDQVLVAAKDLPMGNLMIEADLVWQDWPKVSTSPGMITKSLTPNALEDVKGSVTRANFVQGEPIRREKLAKGPNSGFLSAIIPSGLRAVSINIDAGGSSSVGGFVLPNDHVDVVRIFKDPDASKTLGQEAVSSQTLITNVRVLAIGQNVTEKNGERVVIGANATLELNPQQAEAVILAQRTGTLSLVLRAMVDSTEPLKMVPLGGKVDDDASPSLTVVRFGVPATAGK